MRNHRAILAGRHWTGNLVSSAFGPWLASVCAYVIVVVGRRVLLPPGGAVSAVDLAEAGIVLVLVTAETWVYLRRQAYSPTRVQLITTGCLWVALTILARYGLELYLRDLYAARFLIHVVTGDSEAKSEAIWAVFLVAQAVTPYAIGRVHGCRSGRPSIRQNVLR
jgi:hypothetical protein